MRTKRPLGSNHTTQHREETSISFIHSIDNLGLGLLQYSAGPVKPVMGPGFGPNGPVPGPSTCPNYVGVSYINLISPFQSILDQILG